MKGAAKFPLQSRRDVVMSQVAGAFRQQAALSHAEIDYKLILGWERARAIQKYAENMYWFHSRDVVTKEMLHHSIERDQARIDEMNRCIEVGSATIKTADVTDFKSVMHNVNPNYYEKIEAQPLTHSRDIWRARGQFGSDAGGPKQKFYVRRFKAVFPQGW